MTSRKTQRLCFLYFNVTLHKSVGIATLRFGDETEEDITHMFEEAVKQLPFPTHYPTVYFCETDKAREILNDLEVLDIIDYPGAPQVHIYVRLNFKATHFLPRNPETGEFVDLQAQTKCMDVIRNYHPEAERRFAQKRQQETMDGMQGAAPISGPDDATNVPDDDPGTIASFFAGKT